MTTEITFSGNAYCKIILHAAKYPHCAVNGVLLAETSKSKHPKKLHFVDAVPMCHIAINLTPMAEVALTQIDHIAYNEGLVIAGYYVANENFRDSSFDKSHHRIADKIAENFAGACLVVVDNTKLSLHLEHMCLKVAQYSEGKYRPFDAVKVSVTPQCVLAACGSLLQRRVYRSLIDFDNHLDNVLLDWTNQQVNGDINDILKLYGSLC